MYNFVKNFELITYKKYKIELINTKFKVKMINYIIL